MQNLKSKYSIRGLSLNLVLVIILILLALFLSGIAIYLGVLSRRNNPPPTADKTEAPRAILTPIPSSGSKQTRLLVDSSEKGKLFFIQGTVDSFDGTTIKVSWKGDSDSIRLWQDSNELKVSYPEQKNEVVKKGELKLNVGDYVMYQVQDKLLFVRPQ